MPVSRFLRAAVAVLSLLLVVPASASAQGASTTGAIRGRILDDAGAPVAGSQIVVRNQDTGLERGALSSENGLYVIRLLPPGTYSVTNEVIGFAGETVENVQVVVGTTATVNFELSPQAVEIEGIAIVAEGGGIDVRDAAVTTIVGREEIEELPTVGRDFTDFIQLSGMVAPDPGETTGGQFSIAGSRPSQTSIQIDGVDANNAFFGENRGGSRIPFVFSLESIREFQVITNGFDVEYGSYTGGVVNVVTRGGTNEFEGSLHGNFRSDALTAAPFGAESDPEIEEAEYEVQQFGGSFSGPIVEDKAFFFFSFDGQRRREPRIAITPERFAPGGVDASPAVFADVQRFLEILENQYGITDPGSLYSPFETTNDVLTLFGRVDWNLNDRHRLTLRHNYADYSNENEFFLGDFEYAGSRVETIEDISNSFVAELQSVLGPSTYNVFRFQYADEDRPRNGLDNRPALVVDLAEGEQIGYGGSFVAMQNLLEESKYQFIDNFTHSFGEHTLKLGANIIRTNILNRFIFQGAGTYNFASLDDFENFRPSSFTRNTTPDGSVPTAEFGVTEWAIYAQDEWLVTPRLTATVGLRYDVESFDDAPGRVIPVESAFGFRTGKAPTDNDNISPRLALAYDVEGDGSSVVRAGAGYFYGRIPYVLGGNVASATQPAFALSCGGNLLEGDPDAPPLPNDFETWDRSGSDNPTSCFATAGLTGEPTYTFWHDGFEFPETFKANVGYERLLGERTRGSLDLVFSRSTKLYTVRNLNLRDPLFELEGEDGRLVFQPGSVFDPSAGNPAQAEINSRRNTDFGPVYMNYNDGRAQSFAASFELSHNFEGGAQVTGSYTFTTAQDNSSYSCCTANEGYTSPRVGIFGPNDVGGFGAEDRGWGPSDFVKNHIFILYGMTELPLGIQLSGTWRLESGRPWTPEIRGDLNGDGVRFNDRPFIFSVEDLPVAAEDGSPEEFEARRSYASILANNECIGDYVGQIIPRNSCRFPWYNRLDLQLSRAIPTFSGQNLELQVGFFNVLNGLNSEWGQAVGIFSSSRNLLEPQEYDADTNRILYAVPDAEDFAREEAIGDNLQLQFQIQLAAKYSF